MTRTLDLRPLDDLFGVELDLGGDGAIDQPEVAVAIVDGLLRADLVVLPGLHLDADAHADLLRAVAVRWHRATGSDAAFGPTIPEREVRITDLDAGREPDAGQEPFTVHAGWSLAAPWWSEPPALASLAVVGDGPAGSSLLASTAEAHERLSPAFQSLFADIDARHDRRRSGSWPADGEDRSGIHPLVHHDLRTGRRHLIVSADHTVLVAGHTRPASRKLLAFLAGHLAQPEHTVNQRWPVGTLAIWVNAAIARRALEPRPGTAAATTRSLVAGGHPGPVPGA